MRCYLLLESHLTALWQVVAAAAPVLTPVVEAPKARRSRERGAGEIVV